jgi:hypothetical protein
MPLSDWLMPPDDFRGLPVRFSSARQFDPGKLGDVERPGGFSESAVEYAA